jgi:diguanylate cyclase (GGDEF)-like protein
VPVGVSLPPGTSVAFDESFMRSAIVIPLPHGADLLGMIVLASNNALNARWLDVVRMITAPVTQSLTLANTVARLSASEHKFRGIADTTADGIVLTNTRGTIKYVNASAERMLGSLLDGRSVQTVIPFLESAATGSVLRDDGERVRLEVSTREFEDPPGHLNRVYVLRDLSHHTRLEELAHIANHDSLTGICNRRRFEEELDTRLALSRRHQTSGAVLLIDLDEFKPINDIHGHLAGDRVLQAVAEVLQVHKRNSDMVARLGGDEFVMLLDHTNPEGAACCAARVLEAIRALVIPVDDKLLKINASIGIATFPDDGITRKGLLAMADVALYQAKRNGRNSVGRVPAPGFELETEFVTS